MLIFGALLLVGGVLACFGQRTAGLLAAYCGAQSGLNLYMKAVLSETKLSSVPELRGVPAAFLLTALQQVVAFLFLASVLLCLWPTRWRYTPKSLTSLQEWATVICFSFAFAANIGLNNYSLSLLPVSLNITIRSCLPLCTLAVQLILGRCRPGLGGVAVSAQQVVFMVCGVLCAGLAVLAQSGFVGREHMAMGVSICVLSLFAAALNLVIAGLLGTHLHLNALDSLWYMTVPATLFLLPMVFLMPHSVNWPHAGMMTDWQVIEKAFALNPHAVGLVVVSGGVIAVGYNWLQFTVVQTLSPPMTAFAGNFNKAACISFSMLLGLEALPGGRWSAVLLFALAGNVAAFTGYNLAAAKQKSALEATKGAPKMSNDRLVNAGLVTSVGGA